MRYYLFIITVFCLSELKSQESLLPIYSNPMVFLDSLGNTVGTLPEGIKILNTKDGKHDRGFRYGMAGNFVPTNALIPAKDFNTNIISFFNKTGKFILSYGDLFEAIGPNKGGFHLARRIEGKSSILPRTYYNFLDKNGARIFDYRGYSKADEFNDGYAAVKFEGRWLYITDQGDKFHWIDSTNSNIVDVSSFYCGLSKIKIRAGRCKYNEHFRYIFINQKGDVVIDTDHIFPDKYIRNMGNMRDSISVVKFLTDSCDVHYSEAAYINMEGDVIARFDSVFRASTFVDGYASILFIRKEGKLNVTEEGFIIDKKGNPIGFGKDKKVIELLHIDEQFYWVYLKDKIDSSNYSGVFDASKQKFVFRNKHSVMGIKWDLISLYDSRAKRYYVQNYKTGEFVYDTDISRQLFGNIDKALPYKNEVKRYMCKDETDIQRLHEFKYLEELTLRSMELKHLPESFDFEQMKVLRIDRLKNLEALPAHIKGLKHLSLRDCPLTDNLMEMLSGQHNLEKLFIINFDVSEEEKATIKKMFPNTQITIKGKKKYANSEYLDITPGF